VGLALDRFLILRGLIRSVRGGNFSSAISLIRLLRQPRQQDVQRTGKRNADRIDLGHLGGAKN
jgi:hypothetical protein